MDSEITREQLESQFEEINLKLSNLKMIVEDYPVLRKEYEENDLPSLTETVSGLYETSHKVPDEKLSEISSTLKSTYLHSYIILLFIIFIKIKLISIKFRYHSNARRI